MRFLFMFFLSLMLTSSFSQTLLINEFQARNTSTVKDEKGSYSDWIEIYNAGKENVDLNGYYLTDSLPLKNQHKLSAKGKDLIIPPAGYIILWADGNVKEGSHHLKFKLSQEGEQIGLFSPKLVQIDAVTFGKQEAGKSQGRNPSNIQSWVIFSTPTPGKSNSGEMSSLPLK
jgi:hypothetical protein